MLYFYRMAKPKTDPVHASMARQIRAKRIALGLSMYAVAKQAGISHSTITRIENGRMKPTLDMLVRITQAMGIALWPMLKEAEEKG